MASFISRTKFKQEHYFSNVPLSSWNDAADLGTECEMVWLYLLWSVACERRRTQYASSTLRRRYLLREIADHLGIHIANVRRALSRLADNRLIPDVTYDNKAGKTGRHAVASIGLILANGWMRYYGRSTESCPRPAANASNTIQVAHYIGKVSVHEYLKVQGLGKKAALAWRLLQFSYDCGLAKLKGKPAKAMAEVAERECETSRKAFAGGVRALVAADLLPSKPSRRAGDTDED